MERASRESLMPEYRLSRNTPKISRHPNCFSTQQGTIFSIRHRQTPPNTVSFPSGFRPVPPMAPAATNDPQSPSSSSDPTAYVRSATFARRDAPPPSPDNVVTASDLLLGPYDPSKLHPLAEIGDKLDYLLLDDDKTNDLPGAGTAMPSRGWGDDLCYGTGTTYLSGMSFLFVSFIMLFRFGSSAPRPDIISHLISPPSLTSLLFLLLHHMLIWQRFPGLALGGVWGVREGARRPLAVSNMRLRINSILNSVTRRGTFIGNSAGVLGWRQIFWIALPLFSDVCSPRV
jgi:import inner membrane translocase subunit TIM23